MKTTSWSLAVGLGCILASHVAWGQGGLAPPGPPGPSMKTLDQVEARTPISAAGYQILTGGSYYLTTNLVAALGGSVLSISADDVVVDLNGFSILGVAGTSNGITINTGVDNVVVRNGTIRDCYNHGIFAANATRCAFRNLRVLNNGRHAPSFHGFWAGAGSEVESCLIANNNGNGLRVKDDSRLVNNVITDNGGKGLYVEGAGTHVEGNTVRGNADNYDIAAGNQLNLVICEIPETLERSCAARLAGTLTCSQTGTNGITVAANDVTIDLAGHALIGASNTLAGISCETDVSGLVIHGGTVRNWGRSGIELSIQDCQLYDLIVISNSQSGIYVEGDASVRGCEARENGEYGIFAFHGLVRSCVAANNGYIGIRVGSNGLIEDNIAIDNEYHGIVFYDFSVVRNNTCSNNGRTAGGVGISDYTDFGCAISFGGSRIEGNSLVRNATGIRLDCDGNLVIGNSATQNTTSYDIASGNTVGPIVTSTNIAGSSNPHANYEY